MTIGVFTCFLNPEAHRASNPLSMLFQPAISTTRCHFHNTHTVDKFLSEALTGSGRSSTVEFIARLAVNLSWRTLKVLDP